MNSDYVLIPVAEFNECLKLCKAAIKSKLVYDRNRYMRSLLRDLEKFQDCVDISPEDIRKKGVCIEKAQGNTQAIEGENNG